jgi:hypothetical protein
MYLVKSIRAYNLRNYSLLFVPVFRLLNEVLSDYTRNMIKGGKRDKRGVMNSNRKRKERHSPKNLEQDEPISYHGAMTQQNISAKILCMEVKYLG